MSDDAPKQRTTIFQLDPSQPPERSDWLVVSTNYPGDIRAAIRMRCDVEAAVADRVPVGDIAEAICCMLADLEIDVEVTPARFEKLFP